MKKTIAAMTMCAMLSIAGCAEDKSKGNGMSPPPGQDDGQDDGADDGDTGGPDGGDTGDDGQSDGDGDGTGPTGDDGDTGTDTDGVFIQQPDGGGEDIECDVWAQDCPDDEKCMPWANDGGSSWNATKCSPLDQNPKQPGDDCSVEGSGVSGVDDCDVASMCWDVDPETNVGYCVSFCGGTADAPTCEDPETVCAIYNDGVLPLCLFGCDPLLQDCPNDDLCVPAPGADQGFVCVLDASGEEGQFQDPCEYVNVCDPGLFCANADVVPGCQGSLGCCSEFCDLTDPDPNAACSGAGQGQECVPWFEEGQTPPGLEHVGACVIPS
jgi:hypothetical protein